MQKAGKTQARLVLGADCKKDRAWYEIDGGKREWVQVRGLVEAGDRSLHNIYYQTLCQRRFLVPTSSLLHSISPLLKVPFQNNHS